MNQMKFEAAMLAGSVPLVSSQLGSVLQMQSKIFRSYVISWSRSISLMLKLLLCLLLAVAGQGLWVTSAAAAPVQAAVATHSINVVRPMGRLDEVGYQTIWVEVTRLNPDLSRAEEITVGVVAAGYSGVDDFVTQAVIPPGQQSKVIELTFCWQQTYGQTLVVSNDGSTSISPRSGLLARKQLQVNTPGVQSADYIFFYLTSDPNVRSFNQERFLALGKGDYSQLAAKAANGVEREPLPTFEQLLELLNISPAAELVVGQGSGQNQTPSKSLLNVRVCRNIIAAGPSEVPTTPVGLQIADFFITSVSELQNLASKHPERTEALRQWVAMGGILLVTDCGEDYAGVPSVLPNLTSQQKPSLPVDRLQTWKVLGSLGDAARMATEVKKLAPELQEDRNSYYPYSYNTRLGEDDWLQGKDATGPLLNVTGRGAALAEKISNEEVPFAFTEYGAGRIFALSSDMSDYEAGDWSRVLLNAYGKNQLSPSQNFGVRNSLFGAISGFQVTNVGEPPKVTFLILISMFALLVGPMMFVWLNRINRLHLLLFLIPMLSLLSVFALVGYVIVADGFDFRSARLSVTQLDPVNQTATTQTVQAVYSGSTPGRYKFDRDVVVATDTSDMRNCTLEIAGDETELSGARIAVRTKHQVTDFQTSTTQASLVLQVDDPQVISMDQVQWSKPVVVKNNLSVPLKFLLVKTESGLRVAENVGVGESATLQENGEARSICKELIRSISKGTIRASRSAYQSYSYSYDYLPEVDLFASAGRSGFNVSEVGMVGQQWSMLKSFSEFDELQPGEYVCVCEESPWATDLREDAVYTFQLHLIFGRLVLGRGETK